MIEALRKRSSGVHRMIVAVMLLSGYLGPSTVHAQEAGTAQSPSKIEQLVAPIALYPDSLLSQVLIASTYPLEVVEAARWAHENPGLTGQPLQEALGKQSWDPSVKALVAVPQTLQMMSDKLAWTQELGDVFLAQQQDVLGAVQRLRARAAAAGNLQTTPQQKVTRSSSGAAGSAPLYVIEPAVPDTYYVPIYDPGVAFGAWPYVDDRPFFWYPPGYVIGSALSFAAGVAVGAAIWGHIDWQRRRVNVNVNRYNQFNHTHITNNAWVHNPAHRGNIPYRDRNVAARFGDPNKAAAREAFRGKAQDGQRQLEKQRISGKNPSPSGSDLKRKGDVSGRQAVNAKNTARPNRQVARRDNRAGGRQSANRQAMRTRTPTVQRQSVNRASARRVGHGGGGRRRR